MKSEIQINRENLLPVYKSMSIVIESGSGSYIKDTEGNTYLDFIAGIAVNALGYSDSGFKDALTSQMEKIIHCSNLFYNQPQLDLAEKLISNSPFRKAFFCNSGTEAVEASLKLARKAGGKNKNGAFKIIAMKNSFHGRTLGALSVTGQEKYQKSFKPLLPGVDFADFNDIESLKKLIDPDTCGVIIEPIQGEGGINSAERNFLIQARELCSKEGIALIFDEVQCGIGRTGRLFAFEHYNVVPDIICLAKGLGNGFPIGAILVTAEYNLFEPGDHASTFGGNPLASTAANYVLTRLIDNKLLNYVVEAGAHLSSGLSILKSRYSLIKEIKGLGLMQGIKLDTDVTEIITECRENGLLLVSAGTNVIRFVPPLIVTIPEIDQALKILENAIIKKKG